MTLPAGLVLAPGDGEHLAGFEVRNTIKVPHAATEGAFAAFEETTEPGMGPPVHVHQHQWEYFRVLEGEFEFLIGEHRYRAEAGTVAVVPPNTRHGFRNIADHASTLEFLVTPAGHIDEYFRRLTELLAAGETDTDLLADLGREYDSINVAPPLDGNPV
jgi:quercetin dioxygenase-like cupin family protein